MKTLLCLLFGHRIDTKHDHKGLEINHCTRCEKALLHHPSGTDYTLNATWRENQALFESLFSR